MDNRRLHPRVEGLAYINFGPGNAGVRTNLSEDGCGFQGIGTVDKGKTLPLRFALPGSKDEIEAIGLVVWLNKSGKGGGLRFVELTEGARRQIKTWIAVELLKSQGIEPDSRNPATDKASLIDRGAVEQNSAPQFSPEAATVSLALSPALVAPHSNNGSGLSPQNDNGAVANGAVSAAPTPANAAAAVTPTQSTLLLETSSTLKPVSKPRIHPAAELANNPPVSLLPALTIESLGTGLKESPVVPPKRPSKPRPVEPSKSGPRVLQFVTGVAVGYLVSGVIVGMLLWKVRIRMPDASTVQATAKLNSADSVAKDFQVEVVRLDNQRWMIPMSTGESAPATHSHPSPLPDERDTSVRVAENSTPLRLRTAGIPPVALERPRVNSATTGTIDLQVPPIFNGTTPEQSFLDLRAAGPAPPPASEPPSTPAPTYVGPTNFQAAVLVQRVEPVYPALAREQELQGTVKVSVVIDKDGVPRAMKAVQGNLSLVRAAMAAIAHWRYKPAVLDGQPVESQTIITVNFQF
jgi:TonB family protein